MTTLREAAEIALAALSHPNFQGAEEAETILRDALGRSKSSSKLREALAQPEQEPVADTESDVLTATYMLGVHAGKKVANRKPLTDEEIARIMQPFEAVEPEHPFWVDVARAIEQAHGIGERE